MFKSQDFFQPAISFVSRAITSSSFVGITNTFTLLSGVEMQISSPLLELASSSISTPRYLKYSAMEDLMDLLFSPTPAVNTIASTPFMAAT